MVCQDVLQNRAQGQAEAGRIPSLSATEVPFELHQNSLVCGGPASVHPGHPLVAAALVRLPPTFDLQRFAAEDEGRTEAPTERRQREERDKGNVPKSQDLVGAAVLLGTAVALFFLAGYMFFAVTEVFRRFLGGEMWELEDLNTSDVKQIIFQLFWETAKITGPIFLVAMVVGVVAGISQVGAMFTLQPLAFKPERMMPDFKRILPARRTMYNLAKVLVQVVIIGSVALLIVFQDFIPMLKGGGMGLKQAASLFAWTSFKLLLVTALILLALSVPDYFYQRFEYMENLKMNISEARRERKDEEGDPMIRQRQRERGMQLRQQRNMLQEVPSADVVITNPTHFSVALQYDPSLSAAPVVVAKGADHLAFLIRNIARQHAIPIRESPHLARMIYRDVEVGGEIPADLYQAVSVIFAQLDRFRRRSV